MRSLVRNCRSALPLVAMVAVLMSLRIMILPGATKRRPLALPLSSSLVIIPTLPSSGSEAHAVLQQVGRHRVQLREDGSSHRTRAVSEHDVSSMVSPALPLPPALLGVHALFDPEESADAALVRARLRAVVAPDWRARRARSFRRYIELHRAFAHDRMRGGGEASDVHAAELADVPGHGMLPVRFIIVRPCCQLCNRVRVLISAIALGILTDRAVLMDFDGTGSSTDYYGRFDDLFASPLAVQSKLPARFARHTTANGGGNRVLPWLSMMTDLMCDRPSQWNEPVVTIEGSPAFLHSLLLNPSLASLFANAFGPELDGLFAAIFHELLVPRPDLVSEASAFLAEARRAARRERRADPFVVGLHIRNGRDFRTKKLTAAEWDRIARCARSLDPAAVAGEGEGTPAATNGDSGDSGGIGTVFVVATESEASQQAASASLGSAALVYRPSLKKGSTLNGSTSREGARRALIELLIVSMSNASVLTPMSSFSEAAAALSGRPSLYFHFDLSRKFHFESATEAQPGCFVPWTAETPGSMNLHALIDRLPCGATVRRANEQRRWVHPTGLRFLDGSARMPDSLARKVSVF